MAALKTVLEVTASHLALTVVRGDDVVRAHAIALDRAEWPDDWASALHALQPELAALVSRMDASGSTVVVVYEVPDTAVAVSACPQAAGDAASVAAARLQLASIATSPLNDRPFDVRVIARDGPGAGDARHTHTVAAADSDATLTTLTRWVESAGLRVSALVPQRAAAVAAAVAQIDRSSDHPELNVAVWLGHHSAVLTISADDRLYCIRTIGAGVESLVEAAMKPLRGRAGGESGDTAAPVTPSRGQARQLLAEFGVPSAAQVFPAIPQITGSSLLPALQPALQRFAIEIKQSLRFAVPEERRARGTPLLQLCGPGAKVPNLGDTLARVTGMSLRPADVGPVEDHSVALVVGARAEQLPELHASSSSDRNLVRIIRRGLGVGVGAAVAMLAGSAAWSMLELRNEQQRLQAIESHREGGSAMSDLQKRVLETRLAAQGLVSRIEHRLGADPDWAALMGLVANAVPDPARVMSISMSGPSDPAASIGSGATSGPGCIVRAYVPLTPHTDAPEVIRSIAEAFRQSPLVDSVRLGAIQRTDVRGGPAQVFEIQIQPVPVPAESSRALTALAAPPSEGARP